MRVLVVGGSGVLGRDLARALAIAGHAVTLASRRPPPARGGDGAAPAGGGHGAAPAAWVRVDLATGEGLEVAVGGATAVLHLASDPRRADLVDVGGTGRLVAAARAAGVAHLVYASIVGVDALPLAYYRCKLAAEVSVAGAGVPFSILRTTQFHGFVAWQLGRLARLLPLVVPVPAGFRVQSVATTDVAERLVRALADGPGGRLADFGGPEVLTLAEAARAWRDARGLEKAIWSVPTLGAVAAGFRAGRNTAPGDPRGRVTWGEWLSSPAAS
jgi:uncharacterized protein YbjT (DUF2867 family)